MLAIRTILAASFVALAAQTSPTIAGDAKHGDKMAHMEAAEHQFGDLVLKAPFARATLPNQPVAGGFLSITNVGSEDDVLIAVAAPFAERGEVHEMAMEGDTMKMRELADGLVIPAGETVELKPGGYHLMFMKIQHPLVEGETFDATLEFRNAGSVTITFSIQGKSAKSMDHSGHGS